MSDEIPTVIGSGSHFDGLLSFRGAARVEGVLTGAIQATGRLEIGPHAHVQATIEVDEIVVEGRIEGEIRARDRAELRETAEVVGSLISPRLELAEGSILQGECRTAAPEDVPHVDAQAGEPADAVHAPDSTAKYA